VRAPFGDRIDSVRLRFYQVPTETDGEPLPECDGTARWDSTGVLVAEITAAGIVGLGYAYTGRAATSIARETLVPLLVGSNALATAATFWAMAASVRNAGWPGISASAISALDIAVHDLKSRLMEVSLLTLLGGARDRVPAYGSGGFTNYSDDQLRRQLGGWAELGLHSVKIKIGRDKEKDLSRVAVARDAIETDVALFVDANGAYNPKQALGFAAQFADHGVSWFEEPVSSNDLAGLRLIRDRAPAGMQIAAGEYGYTPDYFWAMLSAGAVDTIQADATRCGGVTGFALAAAQAQAAGIPLSAHTAPALHATLASAYPNVVNVEYFHDHTRIEDLFFDGLPDLVSGTLIPDVTRPGHGLSLKDADAAPYLREDWKS
jgi:L-alanine-DL-glutamate epimerase-like enolase superfamily enzyme